MKTIKKIELSYIITRDLNYEFKVKNTVSFYGVLIYLNKDSNVVNIISNLLNLKYRITNYYIKNNILYLKFD